MGKRQRKRARGAPEPPATTTSYTEEDGSVLTLRDELTEGTLPALERLGASPGATAEDQAKRRMELLFERLAVRWEIAGLPLEGQKELLGRYRMASSEERARVGRTLTEHLRGRHPDIELPV
jgi:hypothetical protein